MAKEEKKETEKKDKWEVRLVITNEEQPPKKVFVKGEETSDLYGMIADLKNDIETMKKALLT